MESKDMLPIGRNSNFWVRVIELRLRFVLLIAFIAIVFTTFSWMVNAWTKFTAGLVDGLDNSVSGDSEFFCPMDPGVVSPWPAICPICNMDLVKRSKTEAQILPSGAVSRMQFTPYRISLAGVKTSLAEPDGKNASPATEESQSPSATTARYKVPLSSIVYWDRNPLVYVESMTNMFDAVPVKIVDRAGDHYIIETSWATPPQVATLGTFYWMPKPRLNPSMSRSTLARLRTYLLLKTHQQSRKSKTSQRKV
ncbi:MAG: heavy metal-binding domain-containing protein [Pirellulales bacterium]